MKKALLIGLLPVGLFILAQCVSMQRWPDYERTAEERMTSIQQKIGQGLETGVLTPEKAQFLLSELENIRNDYLELREKNVYRSEWEDLLKRLDVLEDEVNNALARPAGFEKTGIEERFIAIQRRIDDDRTMRRLTETEAGEFQVRLDAIRNDYSRMTESGRFIRHEDREEIFRRLDLLEADLSRFEGSATISSPSVVTIPAEPDVIVIPGSDVYYIPDIEANIVFYDGNWYRFYEGHWYLSASLSGPWVYIEDPPVVIATLPPRYYGKHRIHFRELKERWREWKREHRWEHED